MKIIWKCIKKRNAKQQGVSFIKVLITSAPAIKEILQASLCKIIETKFGGCKYIGLKLYWIVIYY